LAQLQSVDLISIVEPARAPQNPVRPRKAMNALIAAILGGMVAVGGVFLKETLDTSVRSSEEAQSLTQSPVLGQIWYEQEIARSNGAGPKVVLQRPLSLTAEAFRLLRANLQFAAVDTPLRAVLISSPGPTEGKSTIALNLGLALGAAGRTVIIIDADMRRPKVAAYAGVARGPGLSDALVDREGDVAAYLQAMGDAENVRILPPGQTPPNPSELLGSRRMAEVLTACRGLADVVIVDSPPVLAAADAAVLAAQTDGVLLVLEPRGSDRRAVSQATEQLRRSGARLLGTVLNKVPTNNKGGYYYYYYYQPKADEAQPFWRKVWPWGKKARHTKRAGGQKK
jgi:capsular exopolysaccharide synthesis family protein